MSSWRFGLWTPLVALSVDQLVAWGVLYYAYSVLSVPIARDLHVSPHVVAASFSLTLLVSGLLTPFVGRMLDRVGSRPVLRFGALVAPVAMLALGGVRGEVALVAVLAALGVAHALSLYEPAFRALVEWYPAERDRALALVILTSVGGLASTVFVPLTAALEIGLGWRQTAVALAVLLGITLIPARLAVPASPFTQARAAGRSPSPNRGGNRAWSLVGTAFAVQSFAATGTTVCLVWHLVERGQPLAVAAGLAGVVGAAQVCGRMVFAPAQRMWTTERRLFVELLIQALALIAIAIGSPPVVAVGAVLFGAAAGVMTLERATMVVEWSGREAFGTRNGRVASAVFIARAAAPVAVEQLHAWTSYAGVLALLAFSVAASTLLIARAYGSSPRSDPYACPTRQAVVGQRREPTFAPSVLLEYVCDRVSRRRRGPP